uniref:Uncharacterized protein n=1 Tax=Ciona savignyi TaxID=51511 RepID=H2YML8_CIOSA
MKILLLLLGCIAVSESLLYFYCTGYRRYIVYPKPQVYCYQIQYKSNWCSYKYYEPILHVYPGEDCGKEGWTEKSNDDVKIEMENLLKEALQKIAGKMLASKLAFAQKLAAAIQSYKDQYKTNMTKYFAYYIECAKTDEDKAKLIAQRDDAIKTYNEELEKKRTEALSKCSADILAKIKTITEYHKKLLDGAVKCLATRSEKINTYVQELVNKCISHVSEFTKYHMAILEKKKAYYRAVLDKVHGDADWEKAKVDAVIQVYHDQEVAKINTLVQAYAQKLVAYKLKLISYYRCAYRCYMSNSCLRFYKKSYYSSCRSLGCWYRYTSSYCVVRSCLRPFYYPFSPVSFKGLKTCAVAAVVRDGATIIKEHELKMEEAIKEYIKKFGEWKTKWTQYHIEYCNKYNEIIKQRHEWHIKYVTSQYICINNSEELTDEQKAEIAKLTQELKDKRVAAVLAYKTKLIALLLDCTAKFTKSIGEYREKVKAYIKTIGDNYDACVKKRTDSIAAYRTKLVTYYQAKKDAMYESQRKLKFAHLDSYKKFLKTFHDGDDLPTEVNTMVVAYTGKLYSYCNDLLVKCANNFNAVISQLVVHYACCYTCKEQTFCMPTYCYGGYFRWTVRYPTAPCYRYYYKSYRTSCSYRVRYYKGCYSYC